MYILKDSGILRTLPQLDIFMYIKVYSGPITYSAIFRNVDIFSQFQTLPKSNSCIFWTLFEQIHPRHLCQDVTQVSTPRTPPTLVRNPHNHATHATHASTNSTPFFKLLESPPKTRSSALVNAHLPAPPLLVHKIILTFLTNSSFFCT